MQLIKSIYIGLLCFNLKLVWDLSEVNANQFMGFPIRRMYTLGTRQEKNEILYAMSILEKMYDAPDSISRKEAQKLLSILMQGKHADNGSRSPEYWLLRQG